MARTNKSMDGIELLRKGMRGFSKLKKKYNEAFERGQQSPSKQKIKKMMKYGYRP